MNGKTYIQLIDGNQGNGSRVIIELPHKREAVDIP